MDISHLIGKRIFAYCMNNKIMVGISGTLDYIDDSDSYIIEGKEATFGFGGETVSKVNNLDANTPIITINIS